MITEPQLKLLLKSQESLLKKQKNEEWKSIIESRISLIKYLLNANNDPIPSPKKKNENPDLWNDSSALNHY